MKKMQILLILIILSSIGVLIYASKDLSTYGNFQMAKDSGVKTKVVGVLAKEKPMEYNPAKDPNYFSFFITDNQGEVEKVILRAAKPQDFERSEQIVVTGSYRNGHFEASDLLMKCPSKYKDEEIYIKSKEI
ncbi:MAG: cytochrome c maturation protein CcmE [Saprospiraceae bacterium]|nr:cytochrome c maturation protein CcmE [Saprospiraceae bacterium]